MKFTGSCLKNFSLTLSCGVILTTTLQAQASFKRYTYEQLDRFWINQVLTAGPDDMTTAYTEILQSQDEAEIDQDDRLGGIWGDQSPGTERVEFLVEPIAPAFSAQLAQREISLHMYLNKAEFLEEPQPASRLEQIRLKSQLRPLREQFSLRQHQAATELFLVKFIRYRAAGDLRQKCNYIQQAAYYNELALASRSVTQQGSALDSLAMSITNSPSNRDALQSQLVCQTQDIRSRAAVFKEIEQAVNSNIIESLEQAKRDTIAPIEAQLADIEGLKESVQAIDPKTGALLDFERLMKNSASNIALVNEDAFSVAEMMPAFDLIDYNAIEQITPNFVPEPIKRVQTAETNLITSTVNFLTELEAAASLLPASAGAFYCNGLASTYRNLIPPQPTDGQTPGPFPGLGNSNYMIQRYNSCLNTLYNFLNDSQQKSLNEQFGDVFAAALKELSDAILANPDFNQ